MLRPLTQESQPSHSSQRSLYTTDQVSVVGNRTGENRYPSLIWITIARIDVDDDWRGAWCLENGLLSFLVSLIQIRSGVLFQVAVAMHSRASMDPLEGSSFYCRAVKHRLLQSGLNPFKLPAIISDCQGRYQPSFVHQSLTLT